MSLTLVVPRPVPFGRRVVKGQHTQFPTCDRCHRESSERNPVMLSDRASVDHREFVQGRRRKDAICYECRLAMRGRA